MLIQWLALSRQIQTPPATPTAPTSPLLAPQSQIPYVVLLAVALVIFLLGLFARPLLEDLAGAFRIWVKSLGKAGDFQQRYLDRLIREYRHSSLLPANVVTARWEYRRKAVELEELYTPLSLGGERRDASEGWMVQEENRRDRNPLRRWLRALRRRPEPTAGDIGEIIWDQPRLVVRGDPGSGKTTMLRFIALTCARSVRNNRQDGDSRDFASRRFGWRKRPFPIYVPLNLLGDVSAWPEDRRLLDEIADTLPPELRQRCPARFFEKKLARGNCIVLLDGFDELGSRNARAAMALRIADLAGEHGSDNHFVVSTRIVGYEGQLNRYDFAVRTVQQLNEKAVRDLVTRRYTAIAIGEGIGRSPQEQQDLMAQYLGRADQLLANLQRNHGLRLLTTNPLLLSLIVLVHMVQIALPEQRHLLYRDCVEILTERWQTRRRAESGLPEPDNPDDLTLDAKITLLRLLALLMQSQRDGDDSQAVIARDEVEKLFAAHLPSYIAAFLPADEPARSQECGRRARALVETIREESGILVEKGLDPAGEPVIGFSHLTFQEYLAADAVRERPEALPLLLDHLFDPAWREVLLLYAGMREVTDLIEACLAAADEPWVRRYLLAGRCLAEGAGIEGETRQRVLRGVHAFLLPAATPLLPTAAAYIEQVGREANYDWLIDAFPFLTSEVGIEQLDFDPVAPGAMDPYPAMQDRLLALMQSAADGPSRLAAGGVLGGIGNLDSFLTVPAGPFLLGSVKSHDSMAEKDELPQHRLDLPAFAIAKYPVTNGQYAEFVRATTHAAPEHWPDGRPQPHLTLHPVTYVTWHDARAYCDWLTQTTGRVHRLPTEAEWEKAARGEDGRIWPWGDEAPTERHCNFNNNVGATTPVGAYLDGASPYGALDMAGNVWEWTSSLWGKDWKQADFGYPYDSEDGREDLSAPDAVLRTFRGGSWIHHQAERALRLPGWVYPDFSLVFLGFRVVCSPGS